jgi:sugar phosphate isomerase/epimerase
MSYLRAISTLGCSELTLPAMAVMLRPFQLDAVELRGVAGVLDMPRYFADTYGTPMALATEMGRLGLRVASLDTSYKLAGGTDADRAELLAFVPWAERLGVRWLRVFDGGSPEDPSMMDRALESLAWWRQERGVNRWSCDLMIETHDALFTADRINEFAAAAGGAAILWDSHHTWKRGGEEPTETWARIQQHVVHIHVKDSVSRASERHPFTYVLPGDGEFPAAGLFEVLRSSRFNGVVSLEWERRWHPYLVPVSDALTAAAKRGWW